MLEESEQQPTSMEDLGFNMVFSVRGDILIASELKTRKLPMAEKKPERRIKNTQKERKNIFAELFKGREKQPKKKDCICNKKISKIADVSPLYTARQSKGFTPDPAYIVSEQGIF